MRRLFVLFVLLTASSLIITGPSVGQQKDTPKQKKKDADTVVKEPTTSQDYADLALVKEITGRIANIDINAGTMTITLDWSHFEANPNAKQAGKGDANQKILQLQLQLQRDYDQIMRTNNAVQRQQALLRYQKDLQKLQSTAAGAPAKLDKMFKVVKSNKDFDLAIMADVKVARSELVKKYTDEGEFIKYTPEELKKLKSPDMSTGYTAATADLMPGQTVILHLSPPAKQSTKKTDQDIKKSDPPEQPGYSQIARPRVRMVMILEDTPPPPNPKDLPKKKK